MLCEARYQAAVLNCFDILPSLQTYDVESTSVLTDESDVSATSVFGNELTPTNTTPIPSFVRNDEQDKDQEGPGLVGGICTDCQVMNSEHLGIDCNKFVSFGVVVLAFLCTALMFRN
jgi:hypothetical protein